MIERTEDPRDLEDFWSGPYGADHPFLEAPHGHGCALTTRGGVCDCGPQAAPGTPISPQSGTRGGPGASQGLSGAYSASSIQPMPDPYGRDVEAVSRLARAGAEPRWDLVADHVGEQEDE